MPRLKTDKKRIRKTPQKGISSWLVIGGIALILVAIYFINQGSTDPSRLTSLEVELDQALSEGRPTFVFLHSLECIPCKEMMGVVADVYPEFQDSVVLIDVDIYDKNNANILRRENLQYIPTLVFYDSNGQRQIMIGAMSPDQFRATLQTLAGN
jgi:thiol:disulfide interchange protein